MAAARKKRPDGPGGDTLEHSLSRLEEIAASLEDGSVSLDEAMKIYEEGIRLSRKCLEKLARTELALKKLSKDVNGAFELLDEPPGE